MLQKKYPFDPAIKHHFIIAFGLAVWIFLFLYFTEPLDVNELDAIQKLIYLPIYGLICGACYSVFIPFQVFLIKLSDANLDMLDAINSILIGIWGEISLGCGGI